MSPRRPGFWYPPRGEKDDGKLAKRPPRQGEGIIYDVSSGHLKDSFLEYPAPHKFNKKRLIEILDEELEDKGGLKEEHYIYERRGSNGNIIAIYQLSKNGFLEKLR